MEEHIMRLPWCNDIVVHQQTTTGRNSVFISRKSVEATPATPTPSFDDSVETISTAGITDDSLTSLIPSLSINEYNYGTSSSSLCPKSILKTSSRRRLRQSSTPTPVSFGTVQIRTYERILVAHPACSHGPGIGLGWAYNATDGVTLATYEQTAAEQRNERRAERERHRTAMLDPHLWHTEQLAAAAAISAQDSDQDDHTTATSTNDDDNDILPTVTAAQVLPCQERVELLLEWGVTRREMQRATVEMSRARRERHATVRQVRREIRRAHQRELRQQFVQYWSESRRRRRRGSWWTVRGSNKKGKELRVVELSTEEESSAAAGQQQEQGVHRDDSSSKTTCTLISL